MHADGYGIVTYVNRDRYEGYWKDGMRNSKGVMYYITGDKYDGEWTMNVFSGEGTYTTTTGYIYKGAWAGGKVPPTPSLLSLSLPLFSQRLCRFGD